MDWTLVNNMVDGLFFWAIFTGRRGGYTHLYKQERKRPTPVRRRLSRTHSVIGSHSWRVGAGVGDKSVESCRDVRPLRIPLVIRPVRRTYVVVVRQTDELLCGGYKWVSRFEAPCICTPWTGER